MLQTNFAERFGVTRATCSHWETGRAKPSTKHIEKIANLLAMDANWLITGANSMGQRTAQKAAYNLAHEGRASYVESFYKEAQKAAVEYFSLSVGQRKLVRDQIRYSTLNSKNFMIFKSLTGFRKDHDRAKHQELTPYP